MNKAQVTVTALIFAGTYFRGLKKITLCSIYFRRIAHNRFFEDTKP